ncbi:MAG: ribosomal protein L13e [Promethearchaeota archaeon]
MEPKQKLVAVVKSPSKSGRLRNGEGFSLNEIKQAGKTIKLLEELNIKVDHFRKSVHIENIEKLKSIEVPKKKGKKRESFVKKEKQRTPYKPKKEKPKVKRVTKPKTPPTKPVSKPKKKEKLKPVKAEKIEKAPVKPIGIPLTELSGLGAATAKKLIELGVNNIEDLVKENPSELAPLISGVSLERLTKWIEEGKELIQ